MKLGNREWGIGTRVPAVEAIRSHRDLVVWQKGMLLACLVYGLAAHMPKHEQFGLTSQMVRAAVSVPANIAEGNSRPSRKDYARFVGIARGSISELDTLLILSVDCSVLGKEAVAPAATLCDEVGRMLTALWLKLDAEPSNKLKPSP
jgi:four helix bundle protein